VLAHARQNRPGSVGGLLPAISPSPAAFTPGPGGPTARGRDASVTAGAALAGRRLPGTLIVLTAAFAAALAASAGRLALTRRARRRRAR
jgi:hypothetical protein